MVLCQCKKKKKKYPIFEKFEIESIKITKVLCENLDTFPIFSLIYRTKALFTENLFFDEKKKVFVHFFQQQKKCQKQSFFFLLSYPSLQLQLPFLLLRDSSILFIIRKTTTTSFPLLNLETLVVSPSSTNPPGPQPTFTTTPTARAGTRFPALK